MVSSTCGDVVESRRNYSRTDLSVRVLLLLECERDSRE